MNICIDCGIPVGPNSLRCRVHGAASARGVMRRLREFDISEVIRDWLGLGPDEVAENVGMAPGTVNAHVAHLHRKLASRSAAMDVESGILELGVRLAAEIAASASPPHRADYLRVTGESVTPLVEVKRPAGMGRSFPLREHPFLAEIVATREPRAGLVRTRRFGPRAREFVNHVGIQAGAGVPVNRGGSVHGILSVSSPHAMPSSEMVRRLRDLAKVLETALAQRP